MPVGLLVFYRLLGVLLWVLIFSMLWEKYRIVRGGTLLPAQILDCCRSGRGDDPMTGEMERHTRRDGFFNPRVGAGGYCYRVAFSANGQRMERNTNDSFWFRHNGQQGKTVLVWYNPDEQVVERKSWETELWAVGMGVLATALLLIR